MAKKDDFPKGPEDLQGEDPLWDRRSPLEKELEARTPEEEQEIEVRSRVQKEVEDLRHKKDPDYRVRSRITELNSMELDKAWSPANRLGIEYPKDGPGGNYATVGGQEVGFRWCNDVVREHVGPEGWTKVTDMELAKKYCPTAQLRKAEDGSIMTGDTWLGMQPKRDLEQRNAHMFRKTQNMASAASAGETVGGESMAKLHRATATKSDPIGVRYSSQLTEDQP